MKEGWRKDGGGKKEGWRRAVTFWVRTSRAAGWFSDNKPWI